MQNKRYAKKIKIIWTCLIGIGTLIGVIITILDHNFNKDTETKKFKIDEVDNRPRLIPIENASIENIIPHYITKNDFDTIFTLENAPKNIIFKANDSLYKFKDENVSSQDNGVYTTYSVTVYINVKNTGKRKAKFKAFIIADFDGVLSSSLRDSLLFDEEKSKHLNIIRANPKLEFYFSEINPGEIRSVTGTHTFNFPSSEKLTLYGLVVYCDELNNFYDTEIWTTFNVLQHKVKVLPIYERKQNTFYLKNIEYEPSVNLNSIFKPKFQNCSDAHLYTKEEIHSFESILK